MAKHGGTGNMKKRIMAVMLSVFLLTGSIPVTAAEENTEEIEMSDASETDYTEAADGSTTVAFTFDTSVLQGKTLVVFEALYDTNGNQIVAHSDLNDEDQTVTVPVQPENPTVITGDDSTPMPYVAGLAAALLAIAVIVAALVVKRRRKQA